MSESQPLHLPARKRIWMAVAGLAGLAGLLLQAYLTARLCAARGMDAGATVSKFFSYFTILTNSLIVINCAICVLAPRSRMAASIIRPDVHSGQLLFITIVGSVYITILARLWNPQGLQWWADFLLHYITPGMNLVFWFLFVPKLRMPWTVALRWMIYPLAYFLWVLIRGAITRDYPYPFLDVAKIGYATALTNAGFLTLLFLFGGFAIIGLSRLLARQKRLADPAQATSFS